MASRAIASGIGSVVFAIAVACHSPGSTPAPAETGDLEIGPPTQSVFETERLPAPAKAWSCGGFADLDGDGRADVILAAPDSLLAFKLTSTGWEDHELTPGQPALHAEPFQDERDSGDLLGCEAVDVDNDGDLDVIVASGQDGFVAVNDGNWAFHTVPLPAFPDSDPAVAGALAAFDADGDGLPEIYLVRNLVNPPLEWMPDGCNCDERGVIHCGAAGKIYPGPGTVLLKNLGQDQFEIAANTGAELKQLTYAATSYDLDQDGRQDLLVASEADPNRAFHNLGGLTFSDVSQSLGLTSPNHGMGIALGDLDGDGLTDLVVSELGTPWVLRGHGPGKPFETMETGHGFKRVAQWGWGVEAEDFDNDGSIDLLFMNDPMDGPGYAQLCPQYSSPMPQQSQLLLYRNDGHGHFSGEQPVPSSSPLFATGSNFVGGHTLAVTDLDRDGVLDGLVLPAGRGNGDSREAWYLHGTTMSPNHGLTVGAPEGALVTVCAGGHCQTRQVPGAHSASAIHPRELHFGLGSATMATVKLEWPHGTQHDLGTVDVVASPYVAW